MTLIGTEEATIYYKFNDEILTGYKYWVEENHKIISEDTFYEYITCNYDISDFEIDTAYEGRLHFEEDSEDLEEKIKNLDD